MYRKKRSSRGKISDKWSVYVQEVKKALFTSLRREQGVISLFLCGVVLLMSVSGAIFMDYARVSLAQAESRSTLKLLSHATLSGFDKPVAREFGLFVLRDEKGVQEKAEELLAQRFPSETSSLGVKLDAPQITVTPTDNARLSRPEVMTAQIRQFMDWQIPSIALGKALEHIEMVKKISDTLPALQAKIQYEKQLHGVQQAINACFGKNASAKNLLPAGMNALALPDSVSHLSAEVKKKIFSGVPSPAPVQQNLAEGARQLDENLLHFLQRNAGEQGKTPTDPLAWEKLLSANDRQALQRSFLAWKDQYQGVSSWFERFTKEQEQALEGIKTATERMSLLSASKEAWGKEVRRLPPGAVSQSFLGDYLSATEALDMEKLNHLQEEWQNAGGKTKSFAQAWKALRLDEQPLEDLSFDAWLHSRIASIKRLSANSFALPTISLTTEHPSEWESGIALSEESIKTQGLMAGQSNEDRSGFFEFLNAWNTKRIAIANARRAKRMGLPNLSGGITDFLTNEVLQRYEADAHSKAFTEWTSAAGNEVDMLNEAFSNAKRLADELVGLSLSNAGDTVSLLAYWSNMFSHRISPLMEKENGYPLLSLNGFSLSTRPVFGGELEYILYGRPSWVSNVQQAEHHIIAIRLLCNMLYAFTSSELNAETAQLALALAGWTGFAVPMVQSALLAVLAVGETAVDMDALLAGERVAVMKTQETWQFSLSGVAQLAKKATRDVFDALADEGVAAIEAGTDTLQETVDRLKDSLIQKAQDAVHQPVLRMMEMQLLEANSFSETKQQEEMTQTLQELASRGGEGTFGSAVSNAFSRLSRQSGVLGEILQSAKEKKKQAGETTKEVLQELRQKTEAVVNESCRELSSFANQGIEQLTKKLKRILEEGGPDAENKAIVAYKTFQKEMGVNDAAGSIAAGSALTMNYGDYVLFLLAVNSSTRTGREAMLSQTARLIQAETGGSDFTTAPTSLDWILESRLQVVFLPQFRRSTLVNATGKQVDVREIWQEGYGLKKDSLR